MAHCVYCVPTRAMIVYLTKKILIRVVGFQKSFMTRWKLKNWRKWAYICSEGLDMPMNLHDVKIYFTFLIPNTTIFLENDISIGGVIKLYASLINDNLLLSNITYRNNNSVIFSNKHSYNFKGML